MHLVFVGSRFHQKQDALLHLAPDSLVMVVDVDRCIACGSCLLACRAEHGVFGGIPGQVRRILGQAGADGPRAVSMPTACRHCEAPCEYGGSHNFWTVCPSDRAGSAAQSPACDDCESRLRQGLAPACVTRCSMKCLYAGRPEDVLFVLEERRLRGMGEVVIC